MKYLIGDIKDYLYYNNCAYDAICCTTNMVIKGNGELVMGAGVAKIFKERFPRLPKYWGKHLKSLQNSGYYDQRVMCTNIKDISDLRDGPYLIAFPTKKHWKDYSDIVLIRESTEDLIVLTNAMNFSSVLLPKPGCANGGLNWEKQVKPILGDYLDDRFTIIDKE